MLGDRDSGATATADTQEGPFREELFKELVMFLETAYPHEMTKYVLDSFSHACTHPGADEYCAQEGIWMPPAEEDGLDDAPGDDDDEIPF